MSAMEDPWVALKPPASDAITYLTFIETNLTEETLPKLHEVLQDKELNQAIGWDLVHLLIPLVPASEECLLDVAKLGNPREVVLKVSESLRILELDGMEAHEADQSDAGAEHGSVELSETEAAASAQPKKTIDEAELPLPVLQFRVLLSMLGILHPRIKTKYPSRFLSSTLQAVVATYGEASICYDEMTEDVIKFIKALTGTKRPLLPPRRGSSKVLIAQLLKGDADPEAVAGDEGAEEAAMQRRLLQSFLTHILEDYMMAMKSEDDVPGMGWAARFREKSEPERLIPHQHSMTEQASKTETFQAQLATVGSLVALARDLEIESPQLWRDVLDPTPEIRGDERAEDEPPNSPSEIPLSKTGALFLFTARKAAEVFYDSSIQTPPFSVFPEHANIVKTFLGATARAAMGLEPEALIDAILFLGLLALRDNAVGEPDSDDDFAEYLQNLSLLSANSPSPSLRYQAHYLCTTVLRSHPHDLVRLSFIRDTLEHCPYENLKTSAVSWIKGETIEANPPGATPPSETDETPSIFATPVALSTLSPFLFPDLTQELTAPSLRESYMHFQANLSFYMAALNFYYLLLKAKHLHEPLDVNALSKESDIGGSYLTPLKESAAKFRDGLKEGGELFEGEADVRALAELQLLEDTIARVEDGMKSLVAES